MPSSTVRRMEPELKLPLAQLRRGVLEVCVLSLLARQGRAYAFDLVRHLAEAGMVTSEGTVYPLLSRLRRAELVHTDWVESPSGPPRRYYALTPSGVAALSSFRSDWSAFRDSVESLLQESA